jgi:hypothetical protein
MVVWITATFSDHCSQIDDVPDWLRLKISVTGKDENCKSCAMSLTQLMEMRAR